MFKARVNKAAEFCTAIKISEHAIFLVLFSGKLFKSEDLPLMVDFFLMFYKDKPIDWLVDNLLWVKVCNPEKDAVSMSVNL